MISPSNLNIEDTFTFKKSVLPVGRTSYTKDCPQEVTLICKGKHSRVTGILNEGIHINGKAEWTEMFSGGIAALGGSALNTVDAAVQMFAGGSIQQPWMNRKTYKSTKPLSFDIGISFVADSADNFNDEGPLRSVWQPCEALLAMIYPRELKDKSGNTISMETMLKNNEKLNKLMTDKSGKTKNNIVNNVTSAMSLYRVPGPNISAGSEYDLTESGDDVHLVIGSLLNFEHVYLENVDIEFSNAVNEDGYPLAAKVKLKATVMDSSFVRDDGSFAWSEFSDSAKAMSNLFDNLGNAASDVIKIAKNTIGFYKAFKG